MLETRYRSGVATRIVGLDRQRFNEVVADGDYTCAPATTMRSVRLFTRDDLLPLWVFAGLLALGFSSRSAGELACDLKHAMGVGGGIDRWVYVRSRYDGSVMAEADYDRLHERGLDHPVHGPIQFAILWDLPDLRRQIDDCIEEELAVVGVKGDDD